MLLRPAMLGLTGGRRKPAITYTLLDQSERQGTLGTTSTISDVSFGPDTVGRHIVVCIVPLSSYEIIGCTIAGAPTTSIGKNNASIPTTAIAYIPTGVKSGKIDTFFNSSERALMYAVFAVYNADPVSPVFDIKSQVGAQSVPMNIAEQGLIIGNAAAFSRGANVWTGLTQEIAWEAATGGSVATYSGPAQTNRSCSYGGADGTSFISIKPAD